MNTHVRRLSMDTIGLSLSNAGLSDRMSRSEIALLVPSLPTASQVMMADIENGIFETKNLHIFAVCCEWALGTLHVAELWWDFLITAAALVVKDGFTLVLVAPTPRLTVRASAYLLEFTGQRYGFNWRRAGCTLQLAFNGDLTRLAGACGDRPDWPVSDHFGRRTCTRNS